MTTKRIPQVLCLVGLALTLTGVAFKLNHLAGAHTATNVGVAVLVVGLVLWAIQLLQGRADEADG